MDTNQAEVYVHDVYVIRISYYVLLLLFVVSIYHFGHVVQPCTHDTLGDKVDGITLFILEVHAPHIACDAEVDCVVCGPTAQAFEL